MTKQEAKLLAQAKALAQMLRVADRSVDDSILLGHLSAWIAQRTKLY